MYHTIVIGGGASGLTSAIGLASAGKKILLIEKESLGGECTWSGCIPSKSFIASSNFAKNLTEALELTRKNIHTVGDSEVPHISKFENISLIHGEAKFLDKNTISVNNSIYKGKYIVISTGSSPIIPKIKGLEKINFLTNQNFFYEDKDYKSIIILGAGVISLELALPLRKLGVEVTILERADTFLPMMEEEVRIFYLKKLKEMNISLVLNCSSIEVDKLNDKIEVKTNNGIFLSDRFLISTGRKANIDSLNLDKAQIIYDKKGIIVDKYLRTNIKNIFAIGDVSSPLKFSHIAGYQGEIVVRNILFPYLLKKGDYSFIPWTIFGDTEISKVGLSENDAKKRYKKTYIYTLDGNNDRSLTTFEKDFFLKVICDNKFNIVGVTCIGKRSGEILGLLQMMIGNKIKFYKGINSVQAYPTYSYFIRNLCKKAYIDYIKSFFFLS